MVSIFASIAYLLLDPGGKFLIMAALRLRQPAFGLLEFARMLDYFPRGGRQQVLKSWVDADYAASDAFDLLRLSLDEQAQIPARCRFTMRPHLILPSGNSNL